MMDPRLFDLVNRLRQQHFPPERNFLLAHLTLFHALPGGQLPVIRQDLLRLASVTRRFELQLPSIRFLGKGVAINVQSPPLLNLRNQVAGEWKHLLTPQDQQKFAPHITVQNKTEPDTARRLFAGLSQSWTAQTGTAEGLQLHYYRSGPWELVQTFSFSS
jgi:2'-5' RNA ligase